MNDFRMRRNTEHFHLYSSVERSEIPEQNRDTFNLEAGLYVDLGLEFI